MSDVKDTPDGNSQVVQTDVQTDVWKTEYGNFVADFVAAHPVDASSAKLHILEKASEEELTLQGDMSWEMEKAMKTSPEGLTIIAIGKFGGKIVGYGPGHKPIYAGSAEAKQLAKKLKAQPKKTPLKKVQMSAAQKALQAAKDPFPKDLTTLKEIPAGKFAGSHKNRLFEHPNGKKYLFKDTNEVIARAEEAASRLGQILLPGGVHDAKFVKYAGKPGALVAWRMSASVVPCSMAQRVAIGTKKRASS